MHNPDTWRCIIFHRVLLISLPLSAACGGRRLLLLDLADTAPGAVTFCWPGSSVGIATGYGLDGPGIESRWGARFSAPVQTGPGAHPASCTMGIGSFPGVKSGRGVTLTPHPLLAQWSWEGRAITLLPLWAVRPVQSLSAFTKTKFYCYPLL